ncbi:MAG: ABC transporter permease [Kiritimatiellae bacterium]|nr:ABC transporter permease [Kiritimatiellia bacterium]
MISLWRIFWLEAVALVRSWTALMLVAASLGWMFAAGRILVTDATAEGEREMLVLYGLGGVFALLVIVVLAAATGTIATEREAKRLQLTQVRPVSGFAIAWGKFLALAALSAVVLAFPCATLLVSSEFSGRRCSHVYRPLLESPKEEALKMYDAYMADPETSPMVKKAHKSIVLRILEQRAKDHYQTVQTNETASWTFPGFYDWSHGNPFVEPAARFRFSNSFSMRDEVRGSIQANGFFGVVSNITQTAVTVPLCLCQRGGDHDVLSFTNTGDKPVMLRPRQDVELLVPADSFAWNLLRSYVVMVSVLALVAAFGIFLGSGLSRPVALFVAFVSLIVVEMGPSVIEQYPDSLETDAVDRFGLSIVRAVETCAKPPSALSPLPKLAADDCVEAKDAFGTFAADFLLAPLVLSLLSALVMRRKT